MGAAFRTEHYEIAGYQAAIAMAEALGMEEAVELLTLTLEAEGSAQHARRAKIRQREILREEER
ncbi:DUF892 family protein [Acidisarcina polymorpha]|uniref:DUF892 family protein n=1 Tax=Acidisarcina polymorpha TaxID=2211140 RepID=UPI00308425F8